MSEFSDNLSRKGRGLCFFTKHIKTWGKSYDFTVNLLFLQQKVRKN